jgi:hypothetical protein
MMLSLPDILLLGDYNGAGKVRMLAGSAGIDRVVIHKEYKRITGKTRNNLF